MQFLKLSLVSVLSLTLLACGDDNKDSISDAQAEATAKAMVADVRDVYTAANLDDITTGGESFAEELNAAQMLGQAEVTDIYHTLTTAALVMSHAMDPNYEPIQAEVYSAIAIEVTPSNVFSEDGIDVSIDNNHYTIDQDVNGFSVQLNATGSYETLYEDSLSKDENTWTENKATNANITALNGTISNENYRLTINNGKIVGTYTLTNEETTEYTEESVNRIEDGEEHTNYAVQMTAKLEELNPENDNKISLTGAFNLSAKINATSDEYEINGSSETFDYSNTEDRVNHIENVSVVFNGELNSQQGSSIKIDINVKLKGFTQSIFDNSSYGSLCTQAVCSDKGQNTTPDNANSLASFEIKLELALAGIDQNTSLILSGNTNAVDNGNIKLVFGFAGKTLTIAADSAKQQATLSHSNGAVLTVAENKDGEMIGIIKVKGKQAATISTSSGVPVVRYISGAFESLQ